MKKLSDLAARIDHLPAQADRDWLGEEMLRLMQADEGAVDFGLSNESLAQLFAHLEAMEKGEFVAPFLADDEDDETEPRPKKWKIKMR